MTLPEKVKLAIVLVFSLTSTNAVRADDWPQWRGPNRDGVWSETGILATFPPAGLNTRWRAPIGNGFSSPVVSNGRVFVTDSELAKPKARERIHAFDAMTGQVLWCYTYDVNYPDAAFDEKYPRGPIATPIIDNGRIFSLGASGSVYSLDAVKGDVLWQKNLQQEYPGSEIYPSPSPLIEGELLVLLVGAKPSASIVALNKNTGQQVWKALDDGPTASSPIVVMAAGVRQLIVWTDRSVTSLAPASGSVLWREPLNTTKDAAVSTPVYHDGYLLIGGLMMQLDQHQPAATVLWPKSRATARRVFSDTSTALFRDDFVYSAKSLGEFICVDAKTGEQRWETNKVTDSKSGASVHVTVNGDTALLYNDRGELIRARLTPQGYQEISRTRVLEPPTTWNRNCAWAAPAFANRQIFARSSKELVCASLAIER